MYWRVGFTTFYNSDQSFLLRLHEIHEGPGTGIIAAEYLGDRPDFDDYGHRRQSIKAAMRNFEARNEEEERESEDDDEEQ